LFAVTLHTWTRFVRITNNKIYSNAGTYAGAVRVGTAFLDTQTGAGSSFNTDLTISRNIILRNGGFNLAGAIGLFGGSDNYVVDKNFICGNSGQEYGGAISHFGASEGGTVSNNLIMWNRAIDEGGCLCIASETIAANSMAPYPAYAGNVSIFNNVIQGCISGDDGGGIRFLNPGLSHYYVHGNTISHNVAMHEGGGVSLNDAPFVHFYDNVVVSNIVTGTSLESTNGTIYAAGLATNKLSAPLQALLLQEVDSGYSWNFSHPQNFTNNVFWDNRASNGQFIGDGTSSAPLELQGLGMSGLTPIWSFDMGSSDGGQLEGPTNSAVETIGFYYDSTCGPVLPVYLDQFVDKAPFLCDESISGSAEVLSSVQWGIDIAVQVHGLTVRC
jgi:hypothetical protein